MVVPLLSCSGLQNVEQNEKAVNTTLTNAAVNSSLVQEAGITSWHHKLPLLLLYSFGARNFAVHVSLPAQLYAGPTGRETAVGAKW